MQTRQYQGFTHQTSIDAQIYPIRQYFAAIYSLVNLYSRTLGLHHRVYQLSNQLQPYPDKSAKHVLAQLYRIPESY